MIPEITSCLVCDLVREEANGKLLIIGFFGVCPDVHVRVLHLDRAIPLTFLFSGVGGSGTFGASFALVDESTGRVLAETAERKFKAAPGSIAHLVPTVLTAFGHEGLFTIRCNIQGEEAFKGSFRIAQGTSKELKGRK